MNTIKTTPKDFFLHLAATVFLYAAVIALINLAFEVANRALPDALQTFYGVGQLVWPISMLIVLVPITYVIEWLINRDIVKMPEKKEIWIRRWRIYLTLFLTGVTIIVDLITLINTFLNGEITSRFIYKVIIVFIISAVVFAYYLLSKSGDSAKTKTWRSILMWFGIVLALAAIVGGFIIVGSPSQQRALRFDSERLSDLSNLQYQITTYWQSAGRLPSSLEVFSNPASNYTYFVDPETHNPYGYSVKGATAFELCATFDLSGDVNNQDAVGMNYPYQAPGTKSAWTHTAGQICFERSIDTTLNSPNAPVKAIPPGLNP
jgi:hypothetical protein